jgi:hypothetical protein
VLSAFGWPKKIGHVGLDVRGPIREVGKRQVQLVVVQGRAWGAGACGSISWYGAMVCSAVGSPACFTLAPVCLRRSSLNRIDLEAMVVDGGSELGVDSSNAFASPILRDSRDFSRLLIVADPNLF